MGDRDFPGVMSGKLHLDPMFAPAIEDGPSEPLLTPPSMPVLPEQPVTSQPGHTVGGGPPWLDPTRMGPIFGQYAPDDGPERSMDEMLKPPAGLPRHTARRATPRGWGKNDAGLGVTVGDWQIGGGLNLSTSDRFDTPGTRSRAERLDQDAIDAQRRGESTPDPVGDLVRGERR